MRKRRAFSATRRGKTAFLTNIRLLEEMGRGELFASRSGTIRPTRSMACSREAKPSLLGGKITEERSITITQR